MGHSFQNSSYFALQYNLHHAVINYGSAVLVRIDQCLRTGTVNEAWCVGERLSSEPLAKNCNPEHANKRWDGKCRPTACFFSFTIVRTVH